METEEEEAMATKPRGKLRELGYTDRQIDLMLVGVAFRIVREGIKNEGVAIMPNGSIQFVNADEKPAPPPPPPPPPKPKKPGKVKKNPDGSITTGFEPFKAPPPPAPPKGPVAPPPLPPPPPSTKRRAAPPPPPPPPRKK